MRSLILMSVAALSALMAMAVGAAGQQQQQSGPAHPVAAAQTPPAGQNNIPGDGVRRITPAEVRAALDKGEAIIVDVRGEGSFEAGHVKGARSIPYLDLLSRIDEFPRDKMIITYCS